MPIVEDGDIGFADVITKQLNAKVAEITLQVSLLKAQSETYESTLAKVKSSDQKTFLVHLGDEYFVEKERDDAKSFLTSKIILIDLQIKILDGKIQEMSKSIGNITKAVDQDKNSTETNEEGLLFAEIIEELDEEGNIISAKVNLEEVHVNRYPKLISVNKEAAIESKVNQELGEGKSIETKTQRNDSKKTITNLGGQITSELINEVDTEYEDKLEDLMKEMHVLHTTEINDVKIQKISEMLNELPIEDEHKSIVKESLEPVIDLGQMVDRGNGSTSENVPPKELNDYLVVNKALEIDNIIELEILADQFDEAEVFDQTNEDAEEFDYDFEDLDDDDDEDDDIADEYLYGKNPSFFSDDSMNKQLWEQVSKLRVANTPVMGDVTQNEKSKKSVRFADKLEIKEIENISEAMKHVEYNKPSSLFKQRGIRLSTQYIPFDKTELSAINPKTKDDSPGHESQSERSSFILNDVVIENPLKLEPLSSEDKKKPNASRFKKFKQDQKNSGFINSKARSLIVEPNPIIEEFVMERAPVTDNHVKLDSESNITSDTIVEKILIENFDSKENQMLLHSTILPPSKKTSSYAGNFKPHTTDLDLILNNMMKAYISGEYEDDIETKGHVVQKLDDFEELNRIIESNEFSKLISASEIDEEDEENSQEEDENSQILQDDIVEREVEFDSDNEFEEEIQSDFYQLNKQVSENYHRLRQKLLFNKKADIYDTKDLELEPIDEHGNPVKVSRFKASRSS